MSALSTLNCHSVAQMWQKILNELRGFVGPSAGRRPHRRAAFLERMIFATYWFLAFAILFFAIFWLCQKPALRLGLLLVVSAIFHTHYAGPAG